MVKEEDSPRLEVREEITNGDKDPSCPYCGGTNLYLKKNKKRGKILVMNDGSIEWYPDLNKAKASRDISVYKYVVWCRDCREIFRRMHYG